jgi:glycosyltransferase involved in cell wall biosynthesis
MYCGSCLRDNTLVAELCRQGVDATLIPTYTPILTDEEDRSVDRVFFGGVNVYLQQKLPVFRHLPAFFDRWLDLPWLIRRVARDPVAPNPKLLGELTISMLRGVDGNQRKQVRQLIDWLRDSLHPQIVNFTNILIAGCIPQLKRELDVPIVVTLQGDDVFLDSLPDNYKQQAIERIRELAEHVDAFVVFNRFYADYMQQYLGIGGEKIHQVPLGINLRDFGPPKESDPSGPREPTASRPLTIGYLARLAPEKGFHHLVDAFLKLRQDPTAPAARLLVAGWLGRDHQAYAREQFERLRAAGLADSFEYRGVVDRAQKLQFLREIDLFSVPTEFQDPKGLYVLEALAAGVPVVLPAHGAFPELIESTSGGLLCRPHDTNHLVQRLCELLADSQMRQQLGRQGQAAVATKHSATVMARATLEVYQRLMERA